MKPVKVILNPYAGRWKAKTYIEPLQQTLRRLDIPFEMTITQGPGEGITVARQAVEAGFETVVAAGGDSTISEVVNGLMQAAGDDIAGTLGIVPLGTANDLVYALDIPLDLTAACHRLRANQTRLIDVCRVNDRYFDNNSAVGLEPSVTLEAERITYIKGIARYLVAALRVIWRQPSWYARIEWDNGHYEGAVSLISVGNGPRTGGFFLTPNARLDDGKLDFVFAPAMGRWRLLRLLPQTLSGKHIHHPEVTYLQTTHLRVEIDETPLHTDGEIITRRAKYLTYTILPQKLRVLV